MGKGTNTLRTARAILVVGVLIVVGCLSPTSPSSQDAELTERYWPEAEYRLNYWLGWHNSCKPNFVRPAIRWQAAVSEKTCKYFADSRLVRYNPAVLDGCAAHEIGHAALEQANNPCWHDYEHDLEDAPLQ